MGKLKKAGIYLGIFFVGMIGLIILIYCAEDLRGRAAWENFKKEFGMHWPSLSIHNIYSYFEAFIPLVTPPP